MQPLLNPLRPLGLGELIDRSVNFWRSHWRPLFWLLLGFQLVEGALLAAARGLTRVLFPLASDVEAIKQGTDGAVVHMGGALSLLALAAIGSLFVAQIAGVAATHFSFSRLTDRGHPDGSDSFRHAASRLGTITGAFLLSMAWSVVVMVLLLLPAAGLGAGAIALGLSHQGGPALALAVLAAMALILGAIVLVLWFAIRFILVSQIIAVEPLGAVATFRRANAMSSGRIAPGAGGLVKLRLTVLVTIISMVLLMVGLVASMPMLIAGAVFGANFTPGHTLNDVIPLWALLPLQLLQSVLGALSAPLYVVFQTFFYIDMRVRREGLDLELALGA